jgi:hypothetical protein
MFSRIESYIHRSIGGVIITLGDDSWGMLLGLMPPTLLELTKCHTWKDAHKSFVSQNFMYSLVITRIQNKTLTNLAVNSLLFML